MGWRAGMSGRCRCGNVADNIASYNRLDVSMPFERAMPRRVDATMVRHGPRRSMGEERMGEERMAEERMAEERMGLKSHAMQSKSPFGGLPLSRKERLWVYSHFGAFSGDHAWGLVIAARFPIRGNRIGPVMLFLVQNVMTHCGYIGFSYRERPIPALPTKCWICL